MAEIERKFLVNQLPDLSDIKCNNISQGYISLSPEIRIRSLDDKFYITEKSEGTLVREENEREIDQNTFNSLSTLIIGNIISKKRYRIPLSQTLIAELDIFEDYLDGIITVEVEFSSIEESQTFNPPEWFGKDITADKRYKNRQLSQIEILPREDRALVKKDVQ